MVGWRVGWVNGGEIDGSLAIRNGIRLSVVNNRSILTTLYDASGHAFNIKRQSDEPKQLDTLLLLIFCFICVFLNQKNIENENYYKKVISHSSLFLLFAKTFQKKKKKIVLFFTFSIYMPFGSNVNDTYVKRDDYEQHYVSVMVANANYCTGYVRRCH